MPEANRERRKVEPQPSAGDEPRAGDGKARIEHTLLVVADPDTGAKVQRVLQTLPVTTLAVTTLDDALARMDGTTVGLVALTEASQASATSLLKAWLDDSATESLPVFLLVPETFSDAAARALYGEGATVVFEWPAEMLMIPRVIGEWLEVPADPERPVDEALTRSVAARVELDAALPADIEVDVHGRTAVLKGRVDSLWKRRRLIALVENTPGVEAVDADALRLENAEVDDDTVREDVKNVLRSGGLADSEAITVAVDDGVVTLAGEVASPAEHERVEHLVENVPGVVKLVDRLTIPDESAGPKAETELRRVLQRAFPEGRVRVSIHGNVCVLSGRVPDREMRTAVARAVRERGQFTRVVNKISVGPASPAR